MRFLSFLLAFLMLFSVVFAMDVQDPPVEDLPVEDLPVEDPPAEDLPVEDPPVEDPLVEEEGGGLDDPASGSDSLDVEDGSELPLDGDLQPDSSEVSEVTIQAEKVLLVAEDEPAVYAGSSSGPDGGYYLHCDSSLGEVYVYVPYDYASNSFSFYGGDLVSLRSSSITGILIDGATVYELRFPGFLEVPQYREPDGSSWQWSDISFTSVLGGNVQVLEDDPGYQLDIPTLIILAVVIIVGVRLLGLSR